MVWYKYVLSVMENSSYYVAVCLADDKLKSGPMYVVRPWRRGCGVLRKNTHTLEKARADAKKRNDESGNYYSPEYIRQNAWLNYEVRTTEEVKEVIDEHLQQVNDNTEERIKRIKDIQRYLMYNLRLTELTEKEKDAFISTMEGGDLSDADRAILDNCKSEKELDNRISNIARATYFRRCAWLSYLNGETDVKPPVTQ